uniref:NADH dehydrogenase subunit 4L n=1 Tax=Goniurosaurus bawanglingensis TaxID=2234022 RepID=UPI002A83D0D0|nr:NADH dehydrogenase subunit 4L [Goniurosaurus bawanglingensis]WOA02155.1 NADH dehydrogenase subunit 4L [Goniurosaurus bawanglingensis]
MTTTQLALIMAFILSLLGLTLHRTHLVSALLCIECMLVALFMAMMVLMQNIQLTTTAMLPMTLLTFSACEASAGLALLVATTRTHATDHLKNLNLLQC